MFEIIVLSLISYLICSISFAVIASRIFNTPDPRTSGSSNPGTTNVLRTGNKKAAIFTLIGDALKAIIPIILIKTYYFSVLPFAMVACILGHTNSIFLNFKGGKGIATGLGLYLALNPFLGLSLLGSWVIIFTISRISSLAALIVILLAPIYVYFFLGVPFVIPASIVSGILAYRHKENIERLIKGNEAKLSVK